MVDLESPKLPVLEKICTLSITFHACFFADEDLEFINSKDMIAPGFFCCFFASLYCGLDFSPGKKNFFNFFMFL